VSRIFKPLVVGIGSPHGADAAGWQVAAWLANASVAPWEVKRAVVPSDLLDWLDGCSVLAIIDAAIIVSPKSEPRPQESQAAELEPKPGTEPAFLRPHNMTSARSVEGGAAREDREHLPQVTRRRWPDPAVIAALSATVHDLNLAQVLQLADRLGWLPPHVELWAIHVDPRRPTGLTATAVAHVSRKIAAELLALSGEWQGQADTLVPCANASQPRVVAASEQRDRASSAGQGDA